jgi:Tfp pilus assembly protein PilX
MFRNLKARVGEERGAALITAMLVSMVVVMLGVTAAQLAVHNSEASGYDRRRVQSVGAAEAGVNYYFSHLQSVTADQFVCSASQELGTSPPTSFEATVTFYDAAGAPLPCPPTTTIPKSALIRSVGRTSGTTTPDRTLEAYVNLIPQTGGALGDYAVFSDGSLGMSSGSFVYGGDAHDGDLYTNGNLTLNSGAQIHGSVLAQGGVTVNNGSEVKRDVWARNSVLMQGTSFVRNDVISSSSSIRLAAGSSRIDGDARAGTTITAGASQIGGLRTPNSPSDPPPAEGLPAFPYNPSAWQAAGYQVTTFSNCTTARTFIEGITGGDHVVRITPRCTLSWSADRTVTVRGNLAIISDGDLSMGPRSRFISDGSPPHTLHLVFGLARTSPCGITFSANASIGAGLETLLYTPCTITMNSSAVVVTGQMYAGSVAFNSATNITFKAISVPGVGPGLFEEDIQYIREVVGS